MQLESVTRCGQDGGGERVGEMVEGTEEGILGNSGGSLVRVVERGRRWKCRWKTKVVRYGGSGLRVHRMGSRPDAEGAQHRKWTRYCPVNLVVGFAESFVIETNTFAAELDWLCCESLQVVLSAP